MSRKTQIADIAGATAVQMTLAALLVHATRRATAIETQYDERPQHLLPAPRQPDR